MDQHTLLSLCDDLHQVKGNISQIQATLNQILSKAPSSSKYKELIEVFSSPPGTNFGTGDSKQLAERLAALVNSSQLKVAVKLKTLFDAQKVPLLSSLSKLNFKTATSDDPQLKYLLEFTDEQLASQSIRKYESTGDYPPKIPPINDQSLLLRIFTDKSYRQPSDFLDSVIQGTCFNGNAHNEKLFLKGKALLELIILELVDEAYPNLYEDELEVLQHHVLSADILAKLALGYNLVDSYKFNLSVGISFQEKVHIFGKLFASYVGGLGQVYQLPYVKSFLRAVYAPIISSIRQEQPVTAFAKVQLEFLMSKLVDHTYKFEGVEEEQDTHVVNLLIDDEVVASATSSISLEHAKERAAYDIIQNVGILQRVMGLVIEEYSVDKNVPDKLHEERKLEQEQEQKRQEQHRKEAQEQRQPYHPQTKYTPIPTKSLPAAPHSVHEYPQPYTSISKPVSSLPKLPTSGLSPQPYAPISYNGVPGMPSGPLNAPAITVDPFGVPIIGQSYKVGMENNAKNTLYALLGQHRLTPIYKNAKSGNEFQVSVVVNDQTIGVGYDTNKRFASQKAAMSALGNETGLKTLGIELEKMQ